MRKVVNVAAAIIFAALFVSSGPVDAKKKKKIGIIEGKVITSSGEVLVDVQVVVSGAGTEGMSPSSTNHEGEFSIQIQDPVGQYQLAFSKDGYDSYQIGIPLEAGSRVNNVYSLIDKAQANRRDAVAAYNRGAEAFRSKDFATAQTAFEEASFIDPALAPPFLGLADIHLAEGESQKAADAIESFLALVPDDHQALRIAYNAYQGLDDDPRARARLVQLEGKLVELGDGANLAVDHHNQGVAAVNRNDYAAAVIEFDKAIELDPSLIATRSTLATVLYNLERFDEALAEVDAVLKIEPTNGQALRVRLLVYDSRGDVEKVWEMFDQYAAVDAEAAARLLYRRADEDFRRGSSATAEAALLRILEVAPELPRAHYTLGLVYASSDVAKAKQHFNRFIELAPQDPEVETARSMLSGL